MDDGMQVLVVINPFGAAFPLALRVSELRRYFADVTAASAATNNRLCVVQCMVATSQLLALHIERKYSISFISLIYFILSFLFCYLI